MFDLLDEAGCFNSSILTGGDNTLLHWFCYKKDNDKQTNLLKKLIHKGCDINAQNWEERTPLMISAKSNMKETCRMLLRSGVDISIRDSKGNQAIDLTKPGSECSKLILQEGNNQKFLLSPPTKTNEKVIWRKRIDSASRCISPLNVINNNNNDELNSQCSSRKSSKNHEERIKVSSHPANPRRESEECEKKYERIWEKIHQVTPKRRILKNLSKQRVQSINIKDGSML